MRTIKFRGRSNHPESFSYGDFVFGSLITRGELSPLINTYDENDSRDVRVDPETIGQFTGLKDRNGKEIYEGDIIRRIARISFYGNNKASAHVVKFGEDGIYNGFYLEPQCDVFFVSHNSFVFEVIGNIHDNPELLEGGAQ